MILIRLWQLSIHFRLICLLVHAREDSSCLYTLSNMLSRFHLLIGLAHNNSSPQMQDILIIVVKQTYATKIERYSFSGSNYDGSGSKVDFIIFKV